MLERKQQENIKTKFMRTQLRPKSKHSLEDNEKRKNTWFFFWNLLLRISWKDDSCFYCGWFVCHHFRIQNWIPSIVLLYKKTTPTHWCSHHRLFLFVWLKIRNCVFFFSSNVYIFIFIPRPNEMNNLRYPTAGFLF